MNNQRSDENVWGDAHWYFSKAMMQLLKALVSKMETIINYLNLYIPDKYGKHVRIQKILLDAIEALYDIVVEEKPND